MNQFALGSGAPRLADKLSPRKVETPELKTPELKTPELKTPELKAPELKTPELKTPELKTHTAEDKRQIKKHENTKIVHRKVLKIRFPKGQVEAKLRPS